jgi:serine phosphatase RsbU (regulator of sigma subunit)
MEAKNKILKEEEAPSVQKIDALNAQSFDVRNAEPNFSGELAEKALAASKNISYEKGYVDALTNLGFFYMQKGQNDKGFEALMECLAIHERDQNEVGIGLCLYNLGILHLRIGNFNDAVEYLQKSLSIRMRLGDKAGIAACYFQRAYINQQFNDIDEALKDGERALEIRRELNDTNGMAATLTVISNGYFLKKEFIKAKEIIMQSLKLRHKGNERMGYHASKQRCVEINIELGEYEEARKDAMEGLDAARKEDLPLGVMRFSQSLGNLELKLGNKEEAKRWYTYALEVATNSSYKSFQYEVYELLAEVCSQLNDMVGAFEYYKKFHQVKEEVISLQSNTRLKSLQFINQVESAKREAELEKNKNTELKKAYDLIEEKNKDILDSINYAKRLQDAILPPLSLVKQHLPESFVLYKPKDIVAGDFYWLEVASLSASGGFKESSSNKNTNLVSIPPLEGGEALILIAAADCTGHGVPGALVSVVCSNALNRTVKEFKITETGKILDKVRELVLETFEKSTDNVQDGMDISLAAISYKLSANSIDVQWSGANNALWYVQNNEMKEIPADKQPIGKYYNDTSFNTHTLSLKKGDTLYLFTDGYADQFGGDKGKKFKYKQFQEKLLAISHKPLAEQEKILEKTFEEWKGNLEQVDDVLVIGIRI